MKNSASVDEIKKFWSQRARDYKTKCTATLAEVNLRALEIKTILNHLRAGKKILDVGCGNGYSTIVFAKEYNSDFVGIDYSYEMIKLALENKDLQSSPYAGSLEFLVGDVLNLDFKDSSFDFVVTERCLQNLPEWKLQYQAICEIVRVLKPEGIFLMLECSKTGLQKVQTYRRFFYKPELKNVEPWHNKFLYDDKVLSLSDTLPIKNITIKHFCSTYMYLTRLISNRISKIALKLPNAGSFGYIKLYIIEKL